MDHGVLLWGPGVVMVDVIVGSGRERFWFLDITKMSEIRLMVLP